MNNYLAWIGAIATALCVLAGCFFSGWLKLLKETNALLREQNIDLRAEYAKLTERYTAVVSAEAAMQARINVLSKLPLGGIDKSLKVLISANRKLVESNDKILGILTSSAVTLAKDTGDAARAVDTVRTELAHHPVGQLDSPEQGKEAI